MDDDSHDVSLNQKQFLFRILYLRLFSLSVNVSLKREERKAETRINTHGWTLSSCKHHKMETKYTFCSQFILNTLNLLFPHCVTHLHQRSFMSIQAAGNFSVFQPGPSVPMFLCHSRAAHSLKKRILFS